MSEPTLTRGELERARRQHVRDLRLIERMTDQQFDAFKRNFTLGVCDPAITRRKAIDTLKSMIETNLILQRQADH